MLKQIALTSGLVLGLTAAAPAQDYAPLLEADADLGARLHSIEATPGAIPGPAVTLRVPIARAEGPRFGVLLDAAPADGGIAAFTFHTPENRLIESLHIAPARVPVEADPQDRLEVLRALLLEEAVPALRDRLSGLEVQTTRNTEIAGLGAVEITGIATDDTQGALRWRLVGLLNPRVADSLYALAQVSLRDMPVTGPENFDRSLSGRLLESLRYN